MYHYAPNCPEKAPSMGYNKTIVTFVRNLDKSGGIEMNANQKELFIKNMTENLPTLRKKLDISQEELSEKIGVSRSTIAGIENKKRTMSWNMFLSLLLIFIKNEDTDKLLNVMGIYTDELNAFIKK